MFLHFAVVRREECYLEQKFGDAYRRYRSACRVTCSATETVIFRQHLRQRKIMIKPLFRISVSLGLIGMALGIFMGIKKDFVLVPAHAHLNLLGFVTMFLSALYYRVHPQAAASRLARYQAIISVAGVILFPIGIACVILGGHERFEPLVVSGALDRPCRHGAVCRHRFPHPGSGWPVAGCGSRGG